MDKEFTVIKSKYNGKLYYIIDLPDRYEYIDPKDSAKLIGLVLDLVNKGYKYNGKVDLYNIYLESMRSDIEFLKKIKNILNNSLDN